MWLVAEIEPGGARARLEPSWAGAEVRRRLDDELGLTGWAHALSAAGGAGLVCTLTIDGTSRASAATSPPGVPLEQLAELAFARAARQFGIAPGGSARHESYWVDYDAEAAQALYEPESLVGDAPREPQAPAPELAQSGATGASGETDEGAQPGAEGGAPAELLAMIERLVDRLRDAGLGKEAARLVALHHGGGPEEARELYARLRSLLLSSGAAQG